MSYNMLSKRTFIIIKIIIINVKLDTRKPRKQNSIIMKKKKKKKKSKISKIWGDTRTCIITCLSSKDACTNRVH